MAAESGLNVNIYYLSKLLDFIQNKYSRPAPTEIQEQDSLLARVEWEIQKREGESFEFGAQRGPS